MIAVFKTNVREASHSLAMALKIREHFPLHRITFDLDDCDAVLRIEGADFAPARIMQILGDYGYSCSVLE